MHMKTTPNTLGEETDTHEDHAQHPGEETGTHEDHTQHPGGGDRHTRRPRPTPWGRGQIHMKTTPNTLGEETSTHEDHTQHPGEGDRYT